MTQYLSTNTSSNKNSPIMWIVLGALILIVVGFLVFTSIVERRKNKKLKAEKAKIDKIKESAIEHVSILINLIADFNSKKLKTFIPSVGKLKMSDINNLAKKELTNIENSDDIKYMKEHDIFLKHFYNLLKEKSNNWNKKQAESLKYFIKIEKSLNANKYATYKKEQIKRLEKVYK